MKRMPVDTGKPVSIDGAEGGSTESRHGVVYSRVDGLCEESERLRRSDPRASLRCAEDALSLLGDAEEDKGGWDYNAAHFLCLYALGTSQERLSEYKSAVRYGNEAMRVAEKLAGGARDDAEKAQALDALGRACNLLGNTYDRMGDFMMSLHYRRHNMEIASRHGSRNRRAHCLLQLAAAHYRLADYPTTLECYQEALTIFEETDDRQGEGSAWNGIGNVQYSEGEYADAAESYRKGLVVFEELAEPYWQAGLLGNIAGAYLEIGETVRAREAALQSLVLRARIGDRHGQGYAHDSLARIYLKMERPTKAREAALRSLSLFEEVNDRSGRVYAARTLGRACLKLGENALALRHFRNALSVAEEAGLRELVYQLYELVSEAHEKTGDTLEALEFYKRFHAARDALFTEEREKRLRDLHALHEVDRAKREAELYRKHNRELETANAVQATLLEQLKAQSAELERQARTDSLTGLMNRRHFATAFAEAFAQARESCAPLSVALADVDHFKQINDEQSHAAGDAVLTELGYLLQEHCRPGDIVARYGGEEFVFAFPDTPREEAVAQCEQIRKLVEGRHWFELPPEQRVTLSFGVHEADGETRPERLLSQADTRLYEAKAAGRNCVR